LFGIAGSTRFGGGVGLTWGLDLASCGRTVWGFDRIVPVLTRSLDSLFGSGLCCEGH
jgi:hypothetical protein